MNLYNKTNIRFIDLPVDAFFANGGNVYKKKSTRTAVIVGAVRYLKNRYVITQEFEGVWGYFKLSEMVNNAYEADQASKAIGLQRFMLLF